MNSYRTQSIKNLKNHTLAIGVFLYMSFSVPIIIYHYYKSLDAAEQLLLKHLSNDVSLNDFRFAEQKYLSICKILKVDQLYIMTNSTNLEIDCSEKGFFVIPRQFEFNKNKFRMLFSVDTYIFYLLLNLVLCLLLTVLFLLFRKIETQRRKVIDLQKAQLAQEKQIYDQVAHDIRSPLSVLNMLVPSMASESDKKSELIIQAVNRINGIAEDLLNKGRSVTQNRLIDVRSAIEKLVAEKKTLVSDKVIIKFTHSKIKTSIRIAIDEPAFLRVVSNLLNNAIEALPVGGGRIDLSLECLGSDLILNVMDNGKGIPSSIIEKIGKNGFSYGKENVSSAGSGLGIFYSKSVIEKASGSFEITSSLGLGTVVKIKLPYIG